MFGATAGLFGARRVAGLAAAAAATMGIGQSVMAQCSSYQITQTSGNTITPGVDDTGNHVDDGTTYGLPLPFGFNFYGTIYNTFNVCSNGVVSFGNPTTSTYGNVCPQTYNAAWSPAIFGFWDDLYTSGTANGQGIFTTTAGVSPNRNFYIEFRTQFCCSTAAPVVDFEVVLHESGGFDIIYANPTADPRVGGNSATIGTQDGSGNIQAYLCNTQFINDGDGLSFACPSTYPASCSLAVNPSTVGTLDTFVASVTVTPGIPADPPYSVSLDANSVNGGTVSLYDDGDPAHGDAVAGDLVYSNMVTVGAGTANGNAALTSTVTQGDGQTNTCTHTISINTVALAATGSVNPSSLFPGFSTLFTVNVTPATGPVSTGISVAGDLSTIGGSSTQQFYDDGTHGDVTAGDHVYSYSFTIPNGTPLSQYSIPFSVTDDQGRFAGGNIPLTVGYCAVSTNNNGVCTTTYEFISNVTVGTLNDTRDCTSNSYEDLTSLSADMTQGETVPVSITIGSYWGADHVSVYVDWDNNGSLADPGEETIVTAGGGAGTGQGSQTFASSLTAPANATVGAHRMRVWLTYNIAPTPCLTGQTFGQIKDYTINVASTGPHCGSADFDCNGDVGTDADITAFFACLAGNCPPAPCTSTADFDGDGSVGTDNDISAFFRVLGGGNC